MTSSKRYSIAAAVLGVAMAFVALAVLSRTDRKPDDQVAIRRAILPEADGALRHVLLHWTPNADPLLADAYGDFLRALDPAVSISFVVPRGMTEEEKALFETRLDAIDATGRVRKVARRIETKGPITAWSKDRALVSLSDSSSGRTRLIIPAEPRDGWVERHNDWQTVSAVVAAFPNNFELLSSPFDFDAGDLAVSGGSLIIDTNLLEKNRRRGYSNIAQLAGRLGEYLRMPVVTLGENFGDTPRHHLSMYMTPLTRNHVLVGDPGAAQKLVGENYLPGDLAVETQSPLRADFTEETIARFERAATELASRGFKVTRIPNVPFDDKTYLSYTNGVFEVRNGRHLAYVPTYNIRELDDAAHHVYRTLGWQVIPIHVRKLFPYHGTIGCVVNVLERE